MNNLYTDYVCLTNLVHQYCYATDQSMTQAGYNNVDCFLGTTVFDLKTPVVEIAGQVDMINREIIAIQSPIIIFDICEYTNGLESMLTVKSPHYVNGDLVGVATYGYLLDKKVLSDYIISLYLSSQRLNIQKKFSGICYRVVEYYSDFDLTNQESKILFLLGHGKSRKNISEMMSISPRTTEFHIENIKNKFNLKNKEQVIEFFIYSKLINQIPFDLVFHKNIISQFKNKFIIEKSYNKNTILVD